MPIPSAIKLSCSEIFEYVAKFIMMARINQITVKWATVCNIASKRIESNLTSGTNQVVAGCEKLLYVVESSSTFCNKNLLVRVSPAQGKIILQQVT